MSPAERKREDWRHNRRPGKPWHREPPVKAHPFRPSIVRNDRCLDCGSYEEDGPHAPG